MPIPLSPRTLIAARAAQRRISRPCEGFRRAARQLVRAANGTPISHLPVENPVHFEFVADLRAARALQVEIAASVLDRADELIE
jgi:hypothetical protein